MRSSSVIDAACLSFLIAIHHEQVLNVKKTFLVIAENVNALMKSDLIRVLDKTDVLSADDRCRSFDDFATGYERGENAEVVILKRLENAIENENRI